MRGVRSRLPGLVSLLLCVSGATLPRAAAAPPVNDPALEREVAEVLKELDAPLRTERAAAERKLLKLGTGVLKVLPPPELLPSVAVRDAVNRVRADLERRHAQESVLASRVSMKGRKPLVAWLELIADQTHNTVTARGLATEASEQPVDMIAAKVPFWQALDELRQKAGLEFAAEQPAGEVQFVAASADQATRSVASVYSGPFRIDAAAPRKRMVYGSQDRQILRFQLHIMAEPRLRPLFLQFGMSTQTAVATGKPNVVLRPLSPDAKFELPLAGAGRIPVQFDFNLPAKPNRENAKCRGNPQVVVPTESSSANLRGKLQATIAADSEEIRFKNLGRAAAGPDSPIARRRGGVTATLNRVMIRSTDDGKQDVAIRVSLNYDKGGPAFESHRTWMLHNRVYLASPEGTGFELNGGFETTLHANGEIALEYRFTGVPANAADYTFVYVAPTAIIDVPIEFEFETLPIAAENDADKS